MASRCPLSAGTGPLEIVAFFCETKMSEEHVLSVDHREGVVVMTVRCDQLDEEKTRRMQDEFMTALTDVSDKTAVLDMSAVEFIPSLSLGALVTLSKNCRDQGLRFALAALQPEVRSSLAITHLDKLFEIHDTVDDALQAVQAEPEA